MHTHTKKRLAAGGVLLCLAVGGWIAYEQMMSTSHSVQSELSAEAQAQFGQPAASTTTAVSPTPSSETKTDCFSVTIPFPHTVQSTQSDESSCSVHFKLLKPVGYGHVTVYKNQGPLTENNHLLLRRNNPKDYTEVTVPPLQQFTERYAFRTQQDLIYFLQVRDTLVVVSFAQVQQLATLDISTVETFLNSLSLL